MRPEDDSPQPRPVQFASALTAKLSALRWIIALVALARLSNRSWNRSGLRARKFRIEPIAQWQSPAFKGGRSGNVSILLRIVTEVVKHFLPIGVSREDIPGSHDRVAGATPAVDLVAIGDPGGRRRTVNAPTA